MNNYQQLQAVLTLSQPTIDKLQQRADALQLSLGDYISACLTLDVPAQSIRR